MSGALTKPERSILAECEALIERGMASFIEVGNAMLRIRNDRLYRVEFGTFQEYCQEKWQMTDRHARRLIDAAEIAENLKSDIMSVSPTRSAQIKPLQGLKPEQQREAWKEAAATAKQAGKPTAKEVKLVVEKVTNSSKSERLPAYKPNVALEIADQAVALLKSITSDDKSREAAFKRVAAYCNRQLAT